MNLRHLRLQAVCLLPLLFFAFSLSASSEEVSATFQVSGAVENAQEWSVPKIEHDFAGEIKTLRYTIKGREYSSRCLSLLSFLRAAQPRFKEKTKHSELKFLVQVQSRDGYSTWFSLGELLPDFGDRAVYIALDANGKSWPENEAPLRLIVPGEKDYGRWIYGIQTIRLVDGDTIQAP